MTPGVRRYRKASCRVCIPAALPERLHSDVREIVGVESTNPRKGHATGLLYRVCDEADDAWLTLILMVKPFADGMTEDQLISFYERFGFAIAGRDPVIMVRGPQKPRRLH